MSSLLSEYGVRVYSENFQKMRWGEFSALLSGLSEDSPLGRIVRIRAEDDPKILEHFTPHQHRIRNEWRRKTALRVSAKDRDEVLEMLKNTFISMAGGVTNGQ